MLRDCAEFASPPPLTVVGTLIYDVSLASACSNWSICCDDGFLGPTTLLGFRQLAVRRDSIAIILSPPAKLSLNQVYLSFGQHGRVLFFFLIHPLEIEKPSAHLLH